MTRVRRVLPVLLGVVLAAVAGCSASSGGGTATDAAHGQDAIVMTSAQRGYAVLPSGSRWVLIGTRDGWRTVVNLTPTSVPTDGGLVVAARGADLALGVRPHELLSVSPVFLSADGGARWSPGQLPGGLAAGSTLSVAPRAPTETMALLTAAGGTLAAATRARGPWRTLLDASAPGSPPTLDSVTAYDRGVVVVTARGSADQPLLFDSTNGGRSWSSVIVPSPGAGPTQVFPPCEIAGEWRLPVMSGGRLWVVAGRTLSGPWQPGTPVATGGSPVTACGTTTQWVYSDDEQQTLHVAGPDGWTESEPLNEAPTALFVVAADRAVATVGSASHLVAISVLPNLVETPLPLPGWVATVGGGTMGS